MTHEIFTNKIVSMITTIIREKGEDLKDLDFSKSLYENGLGLDSLDTAAFSAMLEREFGTDPYASGHFPQTVKDVIVFYTSNQANQ